MKRKDPFTLCCFILALCLFLGAFATAQLITTAEVAEKPKAEQVAEALIESINITAKERIERFKSGWTMLWENERASPGEILAALGPKARSVFAAASIARSDLQAMAALAGTTPEALLGDAKYLTPRLPIVIHTDGTVTLAPTP
jgi:hypothetical protein